MNEIGLLGKAQFIEFVDEPNTEQTFIRKEMPSNKQEVWAPRRARLKIKELTEKGTGYKLTIDSEIVKEIAYPYRIGNVPSGWYSIVQHRDKSLPSFLVDSFITINGIECF
jgi:hypothetical protein